MLKIAKVKTDTMLVRVYNNDEYNDYAPNMAIVKVTPNFIKRVNKIQALIANNPDIFDKVGRVEVFYLTENVIFIPTEMEEELEIKDYPDMLYIEPISEELEQKIYDCDTEGVIDCICCLVGKREVNWRGYFKYNESDRVETTTIYNEYWQGG